MGSRKNSRVAGLIFLGAFTFGFAAGGNYVIPGPPINAVKDEIAAFIAGDPLVSVALYQAIQNDFGGTPYRILRHYKPDRPQDFRQLAVEDLKDRRAQPRLYLAENAPDYYRLLVGAFDFDGAFWGAVLISPTGEAVHAWHLSGYPSDSFINVGARKIAYGVAVGPDGSLVVNMQEINGGLVRRSFCGEIVWSKAGSYHHSAELTEDASAFWTFQGSQDDLHAVLTLIDFESGETLRTIDMADVDRANPYISILHMTRRDESIIGPYPPVNPTHPNDIEPLPSWLANAFPMFEPGDLLVNHRNTNLMFVLDPDTFKIKWWKFGALDAGHDPDWMPDGTIVAFDNQARSKGREVAQYSRILSIDPASNDYYPIVDGKDYNFLSWWNGRQQVTSKNTVLITSSTQGRIFEVELSTGDVVFDFINSYEWERNHTLHVSDAFAIDGATAERWLKTECN